MTTIIPTGEVNGQSWSKVRTNATNHHHTFVMRESIVNVLGNMHTLGTVELGGLTVLRRAVGSGKWVPHVAHNSILGGNYGDWKPLATRLADELNRVEANDTSVDGQFTCECE